VVSVEAVNAAAELAQLAAAFRAQSLELVELENEVHALKERAYGITTVGLQRRLELEASALAGRIIYLIARIALDQQRRDELFEQLIINEISACTG
jgi:predicted alpha/beta-hydrolase family hydrolase